MKILTYQKLREIEEHIFSETFSEDQKMEAFEKLSGYYDFLMSKGNSTHHILAASYVRVIEDFIYFSDTVSESIAEGITNIVPFRIDDLESVMSTHRAQYFIQDMVSENVLNQGFFAGDSSREMSKVMNRLVNSSRYQNAITAVKFLSILLDIAVYEYEEVEDQRNTSYEIPMIIQRAVMAAASSNIKPIIEWARENESALLLTRLGHSFGHDGGMNGAFDLHRQGLLKIGDVAARSTSSKAKLDDFVIREKLYGIKPSPREINPIGRIFHMDYTAVVAYLLYAEQLTLDLSLLKIDYGHSHVNAAMQLGKPIPEDRFFPVMAHILSRPSSAQEFLKVLASWIDTQPNIPEGFLENAFQGAILNMGDKTLQVLALYREADSRGLKIAPLAATTDNKKLVEALIVEGSPGTRREIATLDNFLESFPRDWVIECFQRKEASMQESEIQSLITGAPDWLVMGINSLKRTKLSDEMGL